MLQIVVVEKHPIMRQFAKAEDKGLLQGAHGFNFVRQRICLDLDQAPQLPQ